MKHLLTALVIWLGLTFGCAAQTQCLTPMNSAVATPIVSPSAEGSRVLKAAKGCLISVYVNNTGAAALLMVFNSTTVPADGAVTPIHCIPVAATTGYQFVNFAPGPAEYYSTGISVAISTNASCFTKAVGSGAFFHALVQ